MIELNIEDNLLNKASKETLCDLVSKCQERKFSEEVDYLEELGGDQAFEELLSVDFSRGIRESEIEERVKVYGSGVISEAPPQSFLKLLWNALKDFTLRLLLVSAIISIVANQIVETEKRDIAWIEGFSILLAVMVCSFVGAFNDYQKEKQFARLKKVAGKRRNVNVWRDGKLMSIHESQLVTGDLIKITEGMDIPADLLLIEAHNLSADESALTGEPDAVKKRVYVECIAKRDEIILRGEKNSAGAYDVYSPILMSGTSVLNGEGKAIVLTVGESSILGRIRMNLSQEVEKTPLQYKIDQVVKDISKFGLTSGILIFIILMIRFLIERGATQTWGEGKQYISIIDYLIIAITVIVVAIPEGLPLSVTLSLAFSMKKMMKDNNLVRKLQATETMGGADNVCSDKTGTLTQNEMVLTDFWNDSLIEIKVYEKGSLKDLFNERYSELLKQALACNSSATLQPLHGSKTEIAFLKFLENYEVDFNALREKYFNPSYLKIPFSSQRKRMSTVVDHVDPQIEKKMIHIKGASEIILESCSHYYSLKDDEVVPMTEELKEKIEEEITNMANKALRTICIAFKELNGDEDCESKDNKEIYEIEKSNFILLGVLGVRDILRKEVKSAIARCKTAGIKVRMVTGDNKLTARAIATECGIIDPADENSLVLTGPEFVNLTGGVVCKKCKTKECDCPRDRVTAKKTGKPMRIDTIANQEAFDKIYKHLDVLARSRPEDKYALVTGLMERNCVVAVTGDGTNDAPALKKADVGFAMNSGTDVAKEAADIILLDDNFASIVKAAMWGRNIYDNIRKFIQFQFTVNIVATFTTLISSAVLQEELLSAVNLLWVNLVMDLFIAFAYGTEPPGDELLERKPHNKKERIISRTMLKHIIGQALFQFTLLMILAFTGDKWIPEYLDHETIPNYPSEYKYYSADGKHMRSGRPHFTHGIEEDYLRFYDILGPSRHYTFIFNTFVFMQIFNFINCRKIHDEKKFYQGMLKNKFFIPMFILLTALQVIIGTYGGEVFSVSPHGLDARHWLMIVGLSSFSLLLNFILKCIRI